MRVKLENRIKELQVEIVLLQKKIDELPKIRWFQPNEDDAYYYVNVYGYVNTMVYNLPSDINIVKNQLVFKTEKEAIKQSLINKATVRVLKRIAELNEGWLPNWEDNKEIKYIVYYSYRLMRFVVDRFATMKHFDDRFYLKSGGLLNVLINEMEDDLLLMLGVEK